MELNEQNYQEIIQSYPKTKWQPLLDLISGIESQTKFGEIAGGNNDENNIMQMPYWEESPLVLEFRKVISELPIIVNFDWSNWKEGRIMMTDKNFDFDSVSIPIKCKLITAIIRSDRFSEGALVASFGSGLILKILKSIQKQLNWVTKTGYVK